MANTKLKRPSGDLTTKAQAAAAFERLLEYQRLQRNAEHMAQRYTAGTQSYYKNLARADEYSAAVDAWEAVLSHWFAEGKT